MAGNDVFAREKKGWKRAKKRQTGPTTIETKNKWTRRVAQRNQGDKILLLLLLLAAKIILNKDTFYFIWHSFPLFHWLAMRFECEQWFNSSGRRFEYDDVWMCNLDISYWYIEWKGCGKHSHHQASVNSQSLNVPEQECGGKKTTEQNQNEMPKGILLKNVRLAAMISIQIQASIAESELNGKHSNGMWYIEWNSKQVFGTLRISVCVFRKWHKMLERSLTHSNHISMYVLDIAFWLCVFISPAFRQRIFQHRFSICCWCTFSWSVIPFFPRPRPISSFPFKPL